VILGLGIDAVDIDRVRRMLAKHPERMRRRLFTEAELRYVGGKSSPAQHLAVRLAAKEATYKALAGNDLARGIRWRDVEVLSRSKDGAPILVLHGPAEDRFLEMGGGRSLVSLTHSALSAVAVVVIESD
jgi:holo-[acyl-carrier protein] synthase